MTVDIGQNKNIEREETTQKMTTTLNNHQFKT